MSMLGHDMYTIEVIRNQLVDFLNLVEKSCDSMHSRLGGVGDTGERAFTPHRNFVWGQAAFSYSIM